MRTFYSVLTSIAMLTLIGVHSSVFAKTKAEEQAEVLSMQQEALANLYQNKPDTKAQLKSAAGYGVFSNANVNLLFVSVGTGYGVVTNNKSGNKTYMKMAEGGVGVGLGAKDYRIVIVFHTQKAINDFIEKGWTFGGHADAAAKASEQGDSIQGEIYYGDLTVYTMTETGLALQAQVKGTKFWVDEELN